MKRNIQQSLAWYEIGKFTSPAQLPPNVVLALTVRDPRVILPQNKTIVPEQIASGECEYNAVLHFNP